MSHFTTTAEHKYYERIQELNDTFVYVTSCNIVINKETLDTYSLASFQKWLEYETVTIVNDLGNYKEVKNLMKEWIEAPFTSKVYSIAYDTEEDEELVEYLIKDFYPCNEAAKLQRDLWADHTDALKTYFNMATTRNIAPLKAASLMNEIEYNTVFGNAHHTFHAAVTNYQKSARNKR